MRRLSPGRILAAIRARLAGIRYVTEDVLFVIGRFLRRLPRAIARAVAMFWGGLAKWTRIRLLAALGGLATMLVVLAAVSPELPCELPGGRECPPPDSAQGLVPAGALAYLHVDLDPDRDQIAAAGEIAARVPTIVEQLLGGPLEEAPVAAGSLADLVRGVAPWVGEEAAVAVLPGSDDEPTWLFSIDDPAEAGSYAEQITGPGARTEEHREVEIAVDAEGEVASAEVDGFLVIGPQPAVREVIDVAAEPEVASAIADNPLFDELREDLPEARFADGFVSDTGAERLIADGEGALAPLAPFLSPAATEGAAIALSAEGDELELAIRSALDPDVSRAERGFFSALSPFEPDLPGRLGEQTLAYLGFGDPEATVAELLAQAATDAPGVARGFEDLAGELRAEGEIDIENQLLPALGDEAALVIERRGDPEVEAADPVPFLQFVARGVDPAAAREALARLQSPVIEAIDPAIELQAPAFTDLDIDGVPAQTLLVSPTIQLTHAVVDDTAVIATDPLGIERLAAGEGGLDEAEAYQRATAGFAEAVSMIGFLDLRGLVSVAERLGLAADPAYAAFAGEIRALHGLGLAVRLDGDVLVTDARLIVGPPGDAPPLDDPGFGLPPDIDEPDLGLPPELEGPGTEPPPGLDDGGFAPPAPP